MHLGGCRVRLQKQLTAFSLILLIIFINPFDLSNNYIIRSRAATFDDINHPDVFLKQVNGDMQCTLVAATMLVRRAAILAGSSNWADITIDQVMKQAWVDGVGIKYTFTYEGITVNKAQFGSDPVNEAIAILQSHPEGIVIYHQSRIPRSHAVLLTDYTQEMFYCADPSDAVPYGRIPISQGLVQVKDAEYYYYVSNSSTPLPPASKNEDSLIQSIKDITSYEVELSKTDYYYDGNEKRPVVTIPGLEESVDYSVMYINNIDPGSAIVIITGIGEYSGTKIKSFQIREATVYDYFNEISASLSKQTIQVGKTASVKVVLPQALTLVQEFGCDVQGECKEVGISYSSSNSKIAKVSSKGKITGKKKGNAKINVTAELADGTKKVFTFTVKVK